MAAARQFTLQEFSSAICSGIIQGNTPLVTALADSSEKRHSVRNLAETALNKTYELDKEVIGLKGVMTMLTGKGDGETGLIARMDDEMQELKRDMATVKSDMREMKGEVGPTHCEVRAAVSNLAAGRGIDWVGRNWGNGGRSGVVFPAWRD